MLTIDINLILGLVVIAWHYCLFCGYISDDHAAVAQRMDIIPDSEKVDRGESFWVKRFNDGIVMFYLTRIGWKLGFKDWPFPWHLFSLVIHLINVYLVYLFLVPIQGEKIALCAAGFWGVNPMLNQNVVWISGRPYTIGVFLTLIALNCWQDPITFMSYYFLAVVTNISIFFAPILLFLIYPETWQAKMYLGFMLVGALPFIIWKFNKRFTNGLVIDRDNFKFKARKLNTVARIVIYYIWTLFVPVRMGWYHQAGFRYNERWEKFNYLTLIGYLSIFALIFLCKLPGWWYLLGLIPVANLYATNSFLVDRYIYFCSIGIAIIVSPLLAKYPELFWITMTFYITRSYMYSRHLKNDELLYRENWRNHPHSDYAINNLSYFLIQQHRFEEARVVVERGLQINRNNKMLWYNLGISYAAQGHFHNDEGKLRLLRSVDCFSKCLQLEPRWEKPARDLEKIVKALIENKVITMDKGESAGGMQLRIPNLIGLKEVINGTAEIIATQANGATGST